MKKGMTKKNVAYTLDLTKIDGQGDFSCPKCKVNISPEDESENIYSILEVHSKNGLLKEVLITCKICGSTLRILGF